jgi:hypothetical protein
MACTSQKYGNMKRKHVNMTSKDNFSDEGVHGAQMHVHNEHDI